MSVVAVNKREMIDFMALYSGGCMAITTSYDSYKGAHSLLYRPDVERIVSYVESRGYDRIGNIISPEVMSALDVMPTYKDHIINSATGAAANWEHTLFFGLQMFLKRYLSIKITKAMVREAAKFAKAHGIPYPEEGWMVIVEKHGGRLPLRIRALPEGSVVNLKTALAIVENTDNDRLAWLPSFIETAFLRAIWYPTTVATLSMQIKLNIYEYLTRTCETPDQEIGFKLHDFGARGASSQETAMIGGAAHIVNFMGSDTVEAIIRTMEMYGLPYADQMPAFSIPATEHSTMTSWGGPKFEVKAFENAIDKFGSTYPLLAIVSDSYSIRRAVQEYFGETLKEKILATGNTIVVRPDSGDPTIQPVRVVEWLAEKFGTTKNSKGYKVLPKAVRVIQGDGVNQRSIRIILKNLEAAGFSAENLAFGMGGALLQGVNRDTLKFAQKACASKVTVGLNPEIGYPENMTQDGWFDVSKNPEDDKEKKSKAGRLAVVQTGPITYETVRIEELDGRPDALKTVWLNGELIEDTNFMEVRARAHTGFMALSKKNKH